MNQRTGPVFSPLLEKIRRRNSDIGAFLGRASAQRFYTLLAVLGRKVATKNHIGIMRHIFSGEAPATSAARPQQLPYKTL